MRTARFAAAHNQRQFELADLLDQAEVVERVLVNVDAAPDTGVVCTDWNDAKRGFYPFEVLGP